MKSSLFLLAGFAGALSLASCSDNKSTTTETTSTSMPADSTGKSMSTTTTRTYTDADYHSRGDRMATKFASAHKISDAATLAKLKTAYYNRAKRYDEMMTKFQADTAGMAQAKRDYMKANDQEFQTILVVPAQYQAYQSSQSDYDESGNLDTADQGAAASSATMPSSSGMDSTSTTTSSTSTTTTDNSMPAGSGSAVKSSKTKLEDGSKLKVKDDGTVKMKDADGTKSKM